MILLLYLFFGTCSICHELIQNIFLKMLCCLVFFCMDLLDDFTYIFIISSEMYITPYLYYLQVPYNIILYISYIKHLFSKINNGFNVSFSYLFLIY